MADGAFAVEVDAGLGRVAVTLTGFARPADVATMAAALDQALAHFPAVQPGPQVLYDTAAASVQSQEVVAALREVVLRPRVVSALALVSASALAGRQVTRIFADTDHEIFATRADAARWLDRMRRERGAPVAIGHPVPTAPR